MVEREAMALKEDRDLISRLIWRVTDRRESGLRFKIDWVPIQRQLNRLGIDWRIRGSGSAWLLTEQWWFIRRCSARSQAGREANNLRWKIRRAVIREEEVERLYSLAEIRMAEWAEAYVWRRRERLRAKEAAAAEA